MTRRIQTIALLLLALALASPAVAVPIAYNDRTAWNAVVSGSLFLVDFNSYVADTPFSSSAVDVGPFTISRGGGNPAVATVNLIDTTPFSFSGVESVNGSNYVLGFANSTAGTVATSTFVMMMFDTPVAAWGADFRNPNITQGIDMYLIPVGAMSSSDWIFFDASSATTGFFGFVDFASGAAYQGVAITTGAVSVSGFGERFGMDNVSGATIPEPTTAALFAMGLAGIAFVGRQRR